MASRPNPPTASSRRADHRPRGRESPLDLRNLTIDVLRAVGALVDESDGLVEALVPDALRDSFGGESFLKLAFEPQKEKHTDAQLVTIGSPVTEQIAVLAGGIGLAGRWYVAGLRWSQRKAIDLAGWRARFTNARFLGDGIETTFACHYVLMNFRVSYISDERREELRTVVVDASSLQPSPLLQRLWAALPAPIGGTLYVPEHLRPPGATWVAPIALVREPDLKLGDADRLPDREALDVLHRRAVEVLGHQIADSMAHHRRRTERQLRMERLRIETFYDDTEAELRKRLGRAETEERRTTVESKIEANRLDRQRKLADIAAKYRLRLVVELLSAAFITQPKIRTHLKVENRYATADLTVVLDPLLGELELPTCHSCHGAMDSVHLCANGHLVCDACARPCAFCKREYCRDCGVATCAICGRPACPRSQVRCAVCGQITCRDDQGRCH